MWWIGLRAHGGSTGGVDYVWDNGLPITFTHWDKDQPGTTAARTSAGRIFCVFTHPGKQFLSVDSGDGACVAMTSGQVGGFWDDKQ